MGKIFKNVNFDGQITDIAVEGDKIAHIGKTKDTGTDCGGRRVYPGLIDIHSHGCLGFDVMDGHLPEMARHELSAGITTWYPTTMTMSREDIIRAICAPTDIPGGARIPGFHMEGPFIHPKYKGAQNESFIVPASMDFLPDWSPVRMVTLAPDFAGVEEFIRACPAVVSLGHSAATYEQACAAFDAGARCLTHTFNAMAPIHHREPGMIPAAADRTDVYAQLISDGKHVHPSVVRMLVRLFGAERVVLISDSIRATHLGDGDYSFGGQKMIVRGGEARTEDGHFAGSTCTLFECVAAAISFGIPEEDAIRMATATPARLMGLSDRGEIAPGKYADLIFVEDGFRLAGVVLGGEIVSMN